jgi:hypothetical protein
MKRRLGGWVAFAFAFAVACGTADNSNPTGSDDGGGSAAGEGGGGHDGGGAIDGGSSGGRDGTGGGADAGRPGDSGNVEASGGDASMSSSDGASTDAGAHDAGAVEASAPDAPFDAGGKDATGTDASMPDTGSHDAGGMDSSGTDASVPPSDGGLPPTGWLYTVPGHNKIYVSNGTSGSVWMGRGVNMDDIFLCGYNEMLWMTSPDGEHAVTGILASLMSGWKPTFLRVSLATNSFPPYNISWSADTSQYATHMTNVIDAIGTYPNTYVLITLRSEASMVNASNAQCAAGGDDAVCIPTSGTDATYKALVDTFKDKSYVLFGVSNEPGGNAGTQSQIVAAMTHAVGTIRAEEDSLGVPHHIVSVQGLNYTSTIGFYNSSPLAYDNVVYEYHSYPPQSSQYTQSSIPVILGEYGPSGTDTSFTTALYADVEAKQIPNLAWDMDTYNNCAPDLATVTNTTAITPSAWGQVVKTYLNAH